MDGTPFGRYRLVELLGRGGMGEVWRAFDTATDRVVALKVLPANYAGDQVFQERFRREARAAGGLDEPHVVPIYDFGEIEGRFFVSMRLIKGRDLEELLEDGPLEPERAVNVVEQIASALDAAHEIGLVHRDVKPSNILVGKDDFAYLIDFGIARAAGETGLTSTGATIGTWAYMAPERLNDGKADARADIYALACVLHEALTGGRPYPGDSLEQQIVGHLTVPPPRPSTLQAAVPETFDTVIATGMAKDPNQRYATTKDLARAARAAMTTPIQHPSVPVTSPSTPPAQPPTEASGTAAVTSQAPRAQAPTQYAAQADIPPAQESPIPATGQGPLAEQSPPLSKAQLPTMEASAGIEDRTKPAGSLFQRLNRRTKILAVVVAVVVVAVATAVTIVLEKMASPDPVQQLLAIVPSDLHCTTGGFMRSNGAAADVNCDVSGIPKLTILSYSLYTDRAKFNDEVNTGLSSDPKSFAFTNMVIQPCPGMTQSPQQWNSAGRSGKVLCFTSGEGPQVNWTIDSDMVIADVRGQTGGTIGDVYQWWAAHYPQ